MRIFRIGITMGENDWGNISDDQLVIDRISFHEMTNKAEIATLRGE